MAARAPTTPAKKSGGPLSGDQLVKQVRATYGPKTLLAFSTGKDAIAAALALRAGGFDDVIPVVFYAVPGLEFVEDSLAYYEKALFGGRHIYRMPHPSLYRWLGYGLFQPPHRIRILEAANLPQFEFKDVHDLIRQDENCPKALCATGVRAADSPIRRVSIMKHGAISLKKGEYMPIWDWNKERLINEIARSGVKLPIDYRIWGRSFDGLDARFLVPMKKHLPRDYAKILEWFPFAESMVYRYERMNP